MRFLLRIFRRLFCRRFSHPTELLTFLQRSFRIFSDFQNWAESQGRVAVTNSWIETDGWCMPAEEIYPDTDLNFRRSVNQIVAEIGTEEAAKIQMKAMDEAKRKRGWGR